MSYDRDVFQTTNLPKGHIPAPGPYALPVEDSAQEAEVAPPGGSGRSMRPRKPGRRGLQTFMSMGMSVVLLAGLGVTTTVSNDPKLLLAADSFDGSGGDWGTADNGLRWMYPRGAEGLSRSNGAAVANLTSRRRFQESSINVKVRDATVNYSFSFDRLAGGKGAKAIATVRKGPAGAYRGKVRVGGNGRVWLSFSKVRWGDNVPLMSRALELRGWTYRPGQTVRVKMQVISVNSTQLRMKVWPAGANEPARWQLVRNDNDGDVEAYGRVSLRAALTRTAWRTPVNVSFDDFRVNRALDALKVAATALPRTAASKAAAKPEPKQKTAPTDTEPPKIREIKTSNIGWTSAKVTWTLNEPATGRVHYGRTKDYGSWTDKESSFEHKTHVQALTGLEPSTRYHYRVFSSDEADNLVISSDNTFVTAAAPGADDGDPAPEPKPVAARPSPSPRSRPSPSPRSRPSPSPRSRPSPSPRSRPSPSPRSRPSPSPRSRPSPQTPRRRPSSASTYSMSRRPAQTSPGPSTNTRRVRWYTASPKIST